MKNQIPLPDEIKHYRYTLVEAKDTNVYYWLETETDDALEYIKTVFESNRLVKEDKLFVYVHHGEYAGHIGRVTNMDWCLYFGARKDKLYNTKSDYYHSDKISESDFNELVAKKSIFHFHKKHITHVRFKVVLEGYNKPITISAPNLAILHDYDGDVKNCNIVNNILAIDFLGNNVVEGDLVVVGTNSYEDGIAIGKAVSCTNKTILIKPFKIKGKANREEIRVSRTSGSFLKLDDNIKKMLTFKMMGS